MAHSLLCSASPLLKDVLLHTEEAGLVLPGIQVPHFLYKFSGLSLNCCILVVRFLFNLHLVLFFAVTDMRVCLQIKPDFKPFSVITKISN